MLRFASRTSPREPRLPRLAYPFFLDRLGGDYSITLGGKCTKLPTQLLQASCSFPLPPTFKNTLYFSHFTMAPHSEPTTSEVVDAGAGNGPDKATEAPQGHPPASQLGEIARGEGPRIPIFADKYEERQYQKERLALAFRIFAKLGFDEGVAGHITLRVCSFASLFRFLEFTLLILLKYSGERALSNTLNLTCTLSLILYWNLKLGNI
jgi:hypothetical protein